MTTKNWLSGDRSRTASAVAIAASALAIMRSSLSLGELRERRQGQLAAPAARDRRRGGCGVGRAHLAHLRELRFGLVGGEVVGEEEQP